MRDTIPASSPGECAIFQEPSFSCSLSVNRLLWDRKRNSFQDAWVTGPFYKWVALPLLVFSHPCGTQPSGYLEPSLATRESSCGHQDPSARLLSTQQPVCWA